MMTRMRQMSKVMFVFVGLAFIALIVFEWGADYSAGSVDNSVGEVNGEKLSYNEFNELYKQLYQNEKARIQSDLNEDVLERLRSQVWEQFIQRKLFQEQMAKLNISVTDSEVVYQMLNHPIEEFKQNPNFQTNGIFDINKYRQMLPAIDVNQQIAIENFYRMQIPFQKLQNTITNTIRVSESEVKDEYDRQTLRAKVEYLAIMPARFQDSIEVTDEEIEEYYQENIEDYNQEEKRELEYVVFPLTSTANDTANVFEDAERIKSELATGVDFATLALEYSQDPTVNNNSGDLGYFDRETMVKPFSDAAFAANPGDLVGPVQTIHGYHLIKVEDKKVEDGAEKVRASHILLKVTVGSSTMFEMEETAKLFSQDAKDNGWQATVEKNGYETKSTGLFENASGFIPGLQRNPAISNFAFSSNEAAISGLYSVDQGYVIFLLKTVQPAGYIPLDDESLKTRVSNAVKLEKAKAVALEYAAKLENQVTEGTPFKTIAEQSENKIRNVTSNSFNLDGNIMGVGKHADFSANAFKMEIGERSDLVEVENGFYYMQLLEKTAFDSVDYINKKSGIKSKLLITKRNSVFQDWYDQLKEEADIVDNRSRFNIY